MEEMVRSAESLDLELDLALKVEEVDDEGERGFEVGEVDRSHFCRVEGFTGHSSGLLESGTGG